MNTALVTQILYIASTVLFYPWIFQQILTPDAHCPTGRARYGVTVLSWKSRFCCTFEIFMPFVQ